MQEQRGKRAGLSVELPCHTLLLICKESVDDDLDYVCSIYIFVWPPTPSSALRQITAADTLNVQLVKLFNPHCLLENV